MLRTIMFDLDGTLLPFVQDDFVKTYFASLAKTAAKYGYEPQKFVKDLYKGCDSMIRNDGSRLNHDAFWDTFHALNEGLPDIEKVCDEYYITEFDKVKSCLAYECDRRPLIESIRGAGYETVLATTPMFPEGAVRTRLAWVGLRESDFSYITSYSNSRFCKPNADYYREILEKIGREPSECMMIGNSVPEDMIPASGLGMKVFLADEFIENPKNEDVSAYRSGKLGDELLKYIKDC